MRCVPFSTSFEPIERGRLSEEEVSQCLQRSKYGLLSYRPSYLAKSGVFAAYAAHGVACLLVAKPERNLDGLEPGIHFFPGIPEACPAEQEWLAIRAAALSWYNSALRAAPCSSATGVNKKGSPSVISEVAYLWVHRERPQSIMRFLRVSAKRIWHFGGLLLLLLSPYRYKARGAKIGAFFLNAICQSHWAT